jgi:SagB-type dehydrogenase family enzyme
MSHPAPRPGPAYWHDAVYDPTRTLLKAIDSRNLKEGDPAEPLKVKTYPGLARTSLPPPPLALPVPGWPPGPLDDERVSALLYHAYGVNRHDLHPGAWPYHRVVPSARCFFPTEMYLVLPPRPTAPPGVHYYDPMHHTLVQLRGGDHLARLAGSLGAPDARAVVLLSSLFWKTAFRYREYAYRLCAQEAGMVAGNVLAVASALSLGARLHFLVDDERLDGLLGLDGAQENTMLAISLTDGEDIPAATQWDLAAALRVRESGPTFMDFQPRPAPAMTISRIAEAVRQPYRSDLAPGLARPSCQCFLAMQAVHEKSEGLYRVEDDGAGVQMVAGGPVGPLLWESSMAYAAGRSVSSVNFVSAPLTAFLAMPRRGPVADGPHAFRVLSEVAGIAAQQICLASARSGLTARVHNGYFAQVVERHLGLVEGEHSVLFQIAIGAARPAPALRMPVVF